MTEIEKTERTLAHLHDKRRHLILNATAATFPLCTLPWSRDADGKIITDPSAPVVAPNVVPIRPAHTVEASAPASPPVAEKSTTQEFLEWSDTQ
jgi:hypothetical protein